MCTVVLIYEQNPDVPLIVAANRDELLERPWDPPRREGGFVAGFDRRAGGTWMGATAGGFFAALTNIHAPIPGRRSRGDIVVGALRAGGVAAAEAMCAALDARDFSPFNLLFGDAGAVRVAYGRPGVERVAIEEVAPGLRVLPNGPLDAPEIAKVARMRELVAPHAARPWRELLESLPAALGDHHGGDVLHRICVHTPLYGTSSSTLLALEPGRTRGYWFAPGPPCVTPFADLSRLTSSTDLP
jgi:uncharacterized protein with NRDE domain